MALCDDSGQHDHDTFFSAMEKQGGKSCFLAGAEGWGFSTEAYRGMDT